MTQRPQRRAASIAMTTAELDAFLTEQRTCRVGTVNAAGQPHVTPLWFAWDGTSVWLYSLVRSQRWKDVVRDPRIAVSVDTGEDYAELRGVEIIGQATVVGESPRCGRFDEAVSEPERLFAEKYFEGAPFADDGRHGWLRVDADKITSWDFRKRQPSSGRHAKTYSPISTQGTTHTQASNTAISGMGASRNSMK
jgi:nitroimidazol reductase NimA-like FMN-containing flavoprotein (pyridoxamine 5'-phosphate oxidase superfamily)